MKAEIREWLRFIGDFGIDGRDEGRVKKYIRYLLAENDELLFTIKDKAEFIEFLQAEAVDHREIIAELEQRVKELEGEKPKLPMGRWAYISDKTRKHLADLEAKAARYDAQEDYILVKVCLDCMEDMQEVRPGKWQCNNPECPTNQEADNDRA